MTHDVICQGPSRAGTPFGIGVRESGEQSMQIGGREGPAERRAWMLVFSSAEIT
jgi:hypothetical protein